MELAPVPRPRPVLSVGRLGALAGFVAVLALLPMLLGLEHHVVTGGSVAGELDRGTVLLSRQVPVSELAVGDVLVFRPPGSAADSASVGHRIVALGPDGARTRGDADAAPDPWVVPLEAATARRMVLAVPYVGHPSLASRQYLGWGAVGGLALLAAGLVRRVRGVRRRSVLTRWTRLRTRVRT